MKIVYQDANDQHITSKVFFGKAADHKLYEDADLTVQAAEAAITDAFLKGVLVVKVGDVFFTPIKVDGNDVTVFDTEAVTFSAAAAE